MINRIGLFYIVLLLLYAWFCFKMLMIMLQYIPYNTDVAFLGIKQNEIGMLHYKIAFFVHVYTSMLVLPAGFIQFNRNILRKNSWLHRRSGKLYVSCVLLLVAPSGFIMALYANGGIWSQIAFMLLALLWFYSTLRAYQLARKGNFTEHKKWMIRSFALTLSAITLRAWKYILVYLFHPPPMDVYRMVAWLGWTVNIAVAEYIIYKTLKK